MSTTASVGGYLERTGFDVHRWFRLSWLIHSLSPSKASFMDHRSAVNPVGVDSYAQ